MIRILSGKMLKGKQENILPVEGSKERNNKGIHFILIYFWDQIIMLGMKWE